MLLVIVGVIVAIASAAAYMFFMSSPSEPTKEQQAEIKKGTDSEKAKLRERMQAKQKGYFETISKEAAEQKDDGGAKEKVDDSASVNEIQATLQKEETSAEEVIAITAAMKESNFISAEKVNQVWKKHRGEAKGPAEDMIQKAIAKSDKDGDGVIQPGEMARITTAFLKHAGEKMDQAQVFELLDENADGQLTFDEIRTAFKAMWLMKKNGVTLRELMEVRTSSAV